MALKVRYSATISPAATSLGLSASAAAAPHASCAVSLGSWVKYGAIDGETYTFFNGTMPAIPNSGQILRFNLSVDRVDNVATVYLNGAQIFRMTGSNSQEGEEILKSESYDGNYSASDVFRITVYNEPNGQTAETSLGDACTADNNGADGCRNPMAIDNVRLVFFYR